MTTKTIRTPDIQFGHEYDGEKMRRLVDELRTLQRALNSLIEGVNAIEEGSGEIIAITGPALLGREGGIGPAGALSPAQVTALLNLFTDLLQGLVPATGGATGRFLRDDGAWANPAAGVEGYPAALGFAGL